MEFDNETLTWQTVLPWLAELLPDQGSTQEQIAHYSKWLEPINFAEHNFDARIEQICGLVEAQFATRELKSLFSGLDLTTEISVLTVDGFGANISFALNKYPFEFLANATFDQLYTIDGIAIANPRALVYDLVCDFLIQHGCRITLQEAEKQKEASLAIPFSEVIYELLSTFDDREKLILVDRVASRKPRTLDDVGADFAITRERVRQIEKKLIEKIKEWVSHSEDMRYFLPQVKKFIGSISSLSNVLEAFPDLTNTLEPFDLKGWELLPVLMEGVELEENWIFAPSAETCQKEFDQTFEAAAEGIGFVQLANFSSIYNSWGTCNSVELQEWAISRKYRKYEGLLLSPHVQSQIDLAIALLQKEKAPLSIEVLCKTVTPGKHKRNLATRLAEDNRVVRVGPESWALPEWGLDVYDGIQNLIKRRVEAEGTVSLALLLEELPEQYGVAPASVRTYAATFPLQLNGDIVSLAENRREVIRDVNRVRNLYFRDEKLAFRICVNREHLRGSGIMLSGAFAQAVGVQAGETKQWPVKEHESQFAIYWNGGQPRASSIRSLLNDINAQVGDQVALLFGEDALELISIPKNDGPLESQIASLCLLPAGTEVSRKTIAPAIGLPVNSVWSQVIELMRLRKDTELLEILEQYITTLS